MLITYLHGPHRKHSSSIVALVSVAAGTCWTILCPEPALVYPPISRSLHSNGSARYNILSFLLPALFYSISHLSPFHLIFSPIFVIPSSSYVLFYLLLSLLPLLLFYDGPTSLWDVPSSKLGRCTGGFFCQFSRQIPLLPQLLNSRCIITLSLHSALNNLCSWCCLLYRTQTVDQFLVVDIISSQMLRKKYLSRWEYCNAIWIDRSKMRWLSLPDTWVKVELFFRKQAPWLILLECTIPAFWYQSRGTRRYFVLTPRLDRSNRYHSCSNTIQGDPIESWDIP
jgi:hypothetical protein